VDRRFFEHHPDHQVGLVMPMANRAWAWLMLFGIVAGCGRDRAAVRDSRLARFDLVLFLNTNGNVLDDAGREALVRFVRSKKAFVGVHGAAATETDWTWFGGLVGATFKAHPAIQPALVSVADASHPATRHLPASWRRVDEWYGFHENPRAEARGCRTVYLDTFSFQAPSLYRALGYQVRLEIAGFAPGIVKYTMVRELGGSAPGA
jgi:hypothetical protein